MERSTLTSRVIALDREVHRFVSRQSFQAWMRLDVTVPQLKTLFFVSNERGTNPRKLAAALKVTPSNVTGIVDRLVEQGLLSREEDRDDRRVLLLRITEKGESILDDLRERRISSLRETLADLSVDELRSLVDGLSALAASVHAHEQAGTGKKIEVLGMSGKTSHSTAVDDIGALTLFGFRRVRE